MIPPPPRRRGWASTFVFIDLYRHARFTRSWVPLLIVVVTVVALLAGLASQAALPYAIYPAL